MHLAPVVAAVAAIPLAQDTLFGFLPSADLSLDVDQWGAGLSAIATRLANLVAAVVILHSYSDMVRGPDRAVLDVHPVRSRELVMALAMHTLRSRLYLPAAVAVLLLPVGLRGSWVAYGGALGLVFSAWLAGIGVGYLVNLGAVWSAYSDALAQVLDALRGDNPRMQAALIYAPGLALAMVGFSVELGSMGLEAALSGWTLGFLWLGIPMLLGGIAWAFVGRLADAYYVKASLLLAEVDGAWGAADIAESARVVYLDRLGHDRPELRRALRLGWRGLRVYATGGWVAGLLIAVAGWGQPSRAVFWGAGATVWVAAVAALMPARDPQWLDDALGVNALRVWLARVVVALAYSVGVLAPVCAVLMLRHGAYAESLGLLVVAVVCAVVSASAARRWRETAVWAYAGAALVVWAGFMGVMG
jgi:hypothetical protein